MPLDVSHLLVNLLNFLTSAALPPNCTNAGPASLAVSTALICSGEAIDVHWPADVKYGHCIALSVTYRTNIRE